MRASSEEPQAGHASGTASRVPAVVAVEPLVFVQRRARRHRARNGGRPRTRGSGSPARRPRRFSRRIALPPSSRDPAELGEERRRKRVAGLAAQIDDLHRRHRRTEPAAELEPLEPFPALRPRRRAPVDRHSALERGPLRRDRARVVAGVGLLLVGGVVLLVDADQAETQHRREDGRAGSDDDRRLSPRRSARARRAAPPPFRRWSTAMRSPKRAWNRPRVCGVSAISGTRTIAPRPRSSAAAHAWR